MLHKSICDNCNALIEYEIDKEALSERSDALSLWQCEECGYDNQDLIVPMDDVMRYLRVNYQALAIYRDDGPSSSDGESIHRAVFFTMGEDTAPFIQEATLGRKDPVISDVVWFFDGLNGPTVYNPKSSFNKLEEDGRARSSSCENCSSCRDGNCGIDD